MKNKIISKIKKMILNKKIYLLDCIYLIAINLMAYYTVKILLQCGSYEDGTFYTSLYSLPIVFILFAIVLYLNNNFFNKYISNFIIKVASDSILYYNFMYSLIIVDFSKSYSNFHIISYIFSSILILWYFIYSAKKKEFSLLELGICIMFYMTFLDEGSWEIVALIIATINIGLSDDYFWYIYKNKMSNDKKDKDYISYYVTKMKTLLNLFNFIIYLIIRITQSEGLKIILGSGRSDLDYAYLKAVVRIVLFTIFGALFYCLNNRYGEKIENFINEDFVQSIDKKKS